MSVLQRSFFVANFRYVLRAQALQKTRAVGQAELRVGGFNA
jgi:hypothetical protein